MGESAATPSPESDRTEIRNFFQNRFPHIKTDDLKDGIYAIDADARISWEGFEEMPPYEEEVELGERLFHTPFSSGATYQSCFGNPHRGVHGLFPRFDSNSGKLVTLGEAINNCRSQHNAPPLAWESKEIAQLSAYISHSSRGHKIQVSVPNDPRARHWYQRGKLQFNARRGQLNFSCASCHVENAGNRLRDEMLTPALGLISHFPVYRLKTQRLTTVHQRFERCFQQMRAAPLPLQSDEYKAMEYYLGYMASGLESNGPGTRK